MTSRLLGGARRSGERDAQEAVAEELELVVDRQRNVSTSSAGTRLAVTLRSSASAVLDGVRRRLAAVVGDPRRSRREGRCTPATVGEGRGWSATRLVGQRCARRRARAAHGSGWSRSAAGRATSATALASSSATAAGGSDAVDVPPSAHGAGTAVPVCRRCAAAALGPRAGRRSSMARNRGAGGSGTDAGSGTTRAWPARHSTACGSPSPYGPAPVSAKSMVAASANTSLAVVAGSPRACSGAMKVGVPTIIPVAVRPCGQVARDRDAEVGERGSPARVEQDVVGLDVTVDDTAAVRSRERIEQRVEQVLDLRGGERAGRGDAVGEGAPREERHHEHEVGALVLHLEERHDAGMVEPAQRARPPAAGGGGPGRAGRRSRGRGSRLRATGRAVRVLGQLDHAHAAPAQQADDPVASQVASLNRAIASSCSR